MLPSNQGAMSGSVDAKLEKILGKDLSVIDFIIRLYYAMHTPEDLLDDVRYMLEHGECPSVAALMWAFANAPGPCDTSEEFEDALRSDNWAGTSHGLHETTDLGLQLGLPPGSFLSVFRSVAERASIWRERCPEALVLRAMIEVKRDGYLKGVHPSMMEMTLAAVL